MKVAYLSVYRDGTGYSNAAINNILALATTKHDVVCRPITLSSAKIGPTPESLRKFEEKDLQGVQVVIQHCLPSTFEWKSGVVNIGAFAWETTNFSCSSWTRQCNMMDRIWVFCRQSKQAAIDSGVTVPIDIVPHACDLDRFRNPEAQPLSQIGDNDECVFYTIGELIGRKNFAGLIRAYFSTFTRKDKVSLVMKTSAPGSSPEQTSSAVRKMISDIQKGMHVYPNKESYPKIVVISDRLSDIMLDRLHVSCNVFVTPSRGESWGYPANDALGFGNPVIASNWGSFPDMMYEQSEEYFDPDTQEFKHPGQINCGWLIPGQQTFCFGMTDTFSDLYTGKEKWFDPDLTKLSGIMREAYNWTHGDTNSKKLSAVMRSEKFSHKNVGRIMEEVLDGITV